MNTEIPIKIILLWFILIIAMILHFNYHVGDIFYGIDVVKEGANGKVSNGAHIIRNVFYHLPIILILTLMYFKSKSVRLIFFIISIIYTLSHIIHLIKDLASTNASQTPLLSLTLIVSITLNIEQFKYWKSHN